MNTDYSNEIKKVKDNQDDNKLLSTPTITQYEHQIAHGSHVYTPVFMLFLGNAMIYATRNNLLNCRKFFLASVLGAFPATYFTCKYLFGYDKLRRIAKIQAETYASAKYYENSVNKQ
jgi:hypothetical protein